MKRHGKVIAAVLALGITAHAAEITSIDYRVEDGVANLEILANGSIAPQKTENAQDRQIVIDIPGATLGNMASRPLDTSSFNGPVSLVSPYQQGDSVRLVVQLASNSEMTSGDLQSTASGFKLLVGGGGSFASNSTSDGTNPNDDLPGQDQFAPSSNGSSQVRKDPTMTQIDDFLGNRDSQNFSGKPITLQTRDADIRDILRMVADASGFNIVLGPGVDGKLTLTLIDVPWDQALDVVLTTLKLGAERNGNILRIVTLDNLKKEKEEALSAKKAAQLSAPRITRIYPISYADLADISGLVGEFGKTLDNNTGKIKVDKRTNSLIVQDITENLDRVSKLIELLDTQTPQIMVEAKIVETSESFSKEIGGSLGVGREQGITDLGLRFASFNAGDPLSTLTGVGGVFETGADVASQSTRAGFFGMSPKLSFLPNNIRLNALLRIGESDGKSKIVSAPKMVVLNSQEATIIQSKPVLVTSSTTSTQNPTVPLSTTSTQDANISLKATPTVTNDENVLLSLDISRDIPENIAGGQSGISKRNLKTKVLVESGATLVIGGIFISDENETSFGFPLLRKIPIIGHLFGGETEQKSKTELFIFITPKILNIKKAEFNGSSTPQG